MTAEHASAPPSAAAARLGTIIGERYELQAIIGEGGAGVLYRGRHVRTGRAVAIKLLRAQAADTKRAEQRLEREAVAATQLAHRNVVEVLDFDDDGSGQPYLVMELLRGRSLQEELDARERIEPAQLLEWVFPIMGALAIAHDQGVLHRDVKPANVFLAEQASGARLPKLLDFGIARVEGGAALTHPGHVVGTIGFMSPEQLHGEPLTPAADQWSLAAVIIACLTGRAPRDQGGADVSQARLAGAPHEPLMPVVARAFEQEPAARFADMRAFARALLAAATYAGIAVLDDPDPVGLPQWRSWRQALAREDTTLDGSQSAAEVRASAAPPSAAPLPSEGTVLAERFRLKRMLGRGAMGVVYEAEHLSIQRPCAIKLLHPYLAADPELRQRFRKEAQRAGRILHEHVVAVTDYGMSGETPFIVMELLRGESLRELLDRVGALPVERARALAVQISRGLAAAHELGVVHRDLKPQNVFVTRRADGSDCVKILDFGVAKALRNDDSAASTQAGALLGTVRYMAPEQLRSPQDVDQRADVYAAGLIAYEMLAGRPAFDANDVHAAIHQLMYERPPTLDTLRSELPDRLRATIERAMARAPNDRFANATELAQAFESVHDASSSGQEPITAMSAGRSRVRALSIAAVLAALIALALYAWLRSPEDPGVTVSPTRAVPPPEAATPQPDRAADALPPPAMEPSKRVDPHQPGAAPEEAPPAAQEPAPRRERPAAQRDPAPNKKKARLEFDDQNPYE